MEVINMEVPFFPGFYESVYESCDTDWYEIENEMDYLNQEYGFDLDIHNTRDYDMFTFDYASRHNDIAESHCEVVLQYLPDFVKSITNCSISSPKYYNFSTDKLYADFELEDGWEDKMRAFIKENYEWLRVRIREDWTSYDGFCSYMDNDVDEWEHNLFEEKDDRYISTMLSYMAYRANNKVREDVQYAVYENNSDYMYLGYTDELQAMIDEAKEKKEIEKLEPELFAAD